jgi:hypothetical protein
MTIQIIAQKYIKKSTSQFTFLRNNDYVCGLTTAKENREKQTDMDGQ